MRSRDARRFGPPCVCVTLGPRGTAPCWDQRPIHDVADEGDDFGGSRTEVNGGLKSKVQIIKR